MSTPTWEQLAEPFETKKVVLGRALAYIENEPVEDQVAFTMSYTNSDNQTVTLLSASSVLDELRRLRENALLILPMMDEGQAINWITRTFSGWWNRRKQTYGWLDENLKRTDYDPLENYDRKEEGGWSDTDDMAKRKTTETPRVQVTVTQTPHVEMTTEKNIYGDNSSTAVPVEEIVTKPDGVKSDVTVTEPTAGTNVVESDAFKDEHTRLYDDYRVHGNIGVSTVADMLGKEVELRRPIDLIKFALNEWLDLYTVYIN